ncbi:hypothetical protein MBLNU230_g7817t1 [Neophaeotheca triangularis]
MSSPNKFYTSSPTTMMPAAPPEQYFQNSHYAGANGTSPPKDGPLNPFTPSASIPPTPGSIVGRKRSRGDVMDPEEEDIAPDGSLPTPASMTDAPQRGEPVPGPGMTLVYPGDQIQPFSAESQSGTWVEEKSARAPFQLDHMKRPSIASRKSQRVDAHAAGPDDLAQLVLPPGMREATAEPLIDEATRTLGIGWTRMDATEALKVNQAAYARWIEHHFPGLKEVCIWFEYKAMPAYLVAARNAYSGKEAFYIFSNDLTEARLVTTEPAQLLPRLKMLPALHLAAPGGCLRAEMDPITADQNDVERAQINGAAAAVDMNQESAMDSINSGNPGLSSNAGCAAHSMELD